VLAHHLPGWDEWYREITFKFAYHGYAAISPNLYFRSGHGTPEDVAVKVRGAGGVPDDQALGDLEGRCTCCTHCLISMARWEFSEPVQVAATPTWPPAGSRLCGCHRLLGGRVVMNKEDLTPNQPVAPLEYTKDLACPVLGIFGDEDQGPGPAQVNQHEEELKRLGKTYEFYRYAQAGHGFFYYHRPSYRQEQAVDGWAKVFAFLEKYL